MKGRKPIDDNIILNKMSESWVGNRCETSNRALAKKFREALKLSGSEELVSSNQLTRLEKDLLEKRKDSAEKRVAEKFGKWREDGTALIAGVYPNVRAFAYSYRFHNREISRNASTEKAINTVAKLIDREAIEVQRLYELGQDYYLVVNRPN